MSFSNVKLEEDSNIFNIYIECVYFVDTKEVTLRYTKIKFRTKFFN